MFRPDLADSLLTRASRGQLLMGMHCSTMSAQAVELAGLANLDYVILGTEVEQVDPSRLEDLVRTADGAGLASIIKLRRNDPNLAVDAFTTGAQFVLAPHITTGEEYQRMIDASRFAPEGLRGICPVGRFVGYGTTPLRKVIEATRRYNMIIPSIEEREAVDNIDDILSVDEGGILDIGPYDLSLSLGCDAPEHMYANKETMEAIDLVAAKAKEKNKALLGPVWPRGDLSGQEHAAFLRERLQSRGFHLLYDGDLSAMLRHFSRMSGMRAT